jgi:hypothetical protein
MVSFCQYDFSNPSGVMTNVNTEQVDAIVKILKPISSDSVKPMIRIPLTASYWLNITTKASAENFNKYPDLGGQYRQLITKLVAKFTAEGIVTILDLHWSDDDTGNQAMAEKVHPDGSPTGNAIQFWDSVASIFGANKMVFFELYNEPHVSDVSVWMNGNDQFAGITDLLAAVRKHTPDSMVVIAGAKHYAYDVDSLVQLDAVFKASAETHYMWNFHPYQGPHQATDATKDADGFEARIVAVMKGSAAPVMVTEFGQGCCATNGKCYNYNGTYGGQPMGYDEAILNICHKHGVSWMPWAWRPVVVKFGPNTKTCLDVNGGGNGTKEQGLVLAHPVNGIGPDWLTLWNTYAGASLGPTPPPTPPLPTPLPAAPTPVPPTPAGFCNACGYACDANCICGRCNLKPGCDSEIECLGTCNGGKNAKWCGAGSQPTPAAPTPPTPPTPPPPPTPQGKCTACGYACDANCNCGRCNLKPGCDSESTCMGTCNAGKNAKWCGGGSTPTPAPAAPTPAPAAPTPAGTCTACGYECDANCVCGRCNLKPGCDSESTCMGTCNAGKNAKWCGGGAPTPVPPGPAPSGCPGGSLTACMDLCPSDPPAAYKACIDDCVKRCS